MSSGAIEFRVPISMATAASTRESSSSSGSYNAFAFGICYIFFATAAVSFIRLVAARSAAVLSRALRGRAELKRLFSLQFSALIEGTFWRAPSAVRPA